MNSIARAFDPMGAKTADGAEKDASAAARAKSAAELEREQDVEAMRRIGLIFGLEPEEFVRESRSRGITT